MSGQQQLLPQALLKKNLLVPLVLPKMQGQHYLPQARLPQAPLKMQSLKEAALLKMYAQALLEMESLQTTASTLPGWPWTSNGTPDVAAMCPCCRSCSGKTRYTNPAALASAHAHQTSTNNHGGVYIYIYVYFSKIYICMEIYNLAQNINEPWACPMSSA